MREKIEEEIKESLGVKKPHLRYEGLFKRRKRKSGKEYEYYEAKFYDLETKKIVNVHVKVEKEELIKKLDKEWKQAKRKEEELKREIINLFNKYQNPQLIKRAVEELLQEGIKREAKDFAYEKYKQKALNLFEEFKPYLLELKKNKVGRISLLQTLYLLSNVRETFKDKGEDELKKALKRAISTIILRNKNQKLHNPFGVLKNDFFLPKESPYDFLLSPFLESELSPIFDKLLEAEKEKLETQEAMAQISEFVASLSEKAKTRILKVFPSISEFSKALFANFKSSGQEIDMFLREWKEYLEMELPQREENKLLNDLKKILNA